MTLVVQISAGVGPVEVRRFVAHLAARLQAAHEVTVLAQRCHGPEDAPRSVELVVEGALDGWEGTHELVAATRGRRARRRWFCEVRAFCPTELHGFDERDCDVRVCRAGGPGGQHVNRRNTAVRVTHRPTGLSVRAEGERSQAQNRGSAFGRLRELVEEHARGQHARATEGRRHAHYELTRGVPDHRWRLDHRGRLARADGAERGRAE